MRCQELLDWFGRCHVRATGRDGIQQSEKILRRCRRESVHRDRHDVRAAAIGQGEADRHALGHRIAAGVGDGRYAGGVGKAYQHRSGSPLQMRRLAYAGRFGGGRKRAFGHDALGMIGTKSLVRPVRQFGHGIDQLFRHRLGGGGGFIGGGMAGAA